ncbi:Uncharacterised protein [Mycobacteroides abscessus subsp. abscessus]|nr:Uncharacterised protein [Mycobacteroides abscessus subsp. abscessus]
MRLLAGLGHGVGQLGGAVSTAGHALVHGHPRPGPLGDLPDDGVLAGVVGREGVDRHDGADAEAAQDRQVLEQVRGPGAHVLGVLGQQLLGQGLAGHDPVASGVGLQRPDGDHEDRGVRGQPGDPALDVDEALGTHVRSESGLGDDVVGVLQGGVVGEDRGVAGGDVAEGPGVDQGGDPFEGLHQVRVDHVGQQSRQRAVGLQVLGGHGRAVPGGGHDDAGQPGLQIRQIRGQGEDDHDLAGRGDVEAALAGDPVLALPQADDDVAQGAVVDVQDAPPRDAALVDVQGVAVVQMVVQQRREHVVRGGDGVEVPGQVQVELVRSRWPR